MSNLLRPDMRGGKPSMLGRNLPKLYAARFLFYCYLGTSVLIPFFRDWGGLSYSAVMALQAWFMVATVGLEVPSGSFADRFGRRASMVGSALSGVMASFVLVSGPSLWSLVLGQLLLALAYALFSGADVALAYDTLVAIDRTTDAPKVYGRLEALKLAGLMLGSVIGAPLASQLGLAAPVLWRALPFGLCGVAAWMAVEPAHVAPPGVASRPLAYRQLLVAGVRALRDPVLRRLMWHSVLPDAFLFMVLWLYQPLCERAGIDLTWFGAIHAMLSASQILWLSQLQRAQRRLGGDVRVVYWSAIVGGLALLPLAVTDSPGPVVVCVVLSSTFGLTRRPIFLSAFNARIEAGERATVLSTINMVRLALLGGALLLMGEGLERSIPATVCAVALAALASTVWTRLSSNEFEIEATPAAVPVRSAED